MRKIYCQQLRFLVRQEHYGMEIIEKIVTDNELFFLLLLKNVPIFDLSLFIFLALTVIFIDLPWEFIRIFEHLILLSNTL